MMRFISMFSFPYSLFLAYLFLSSFVILSMPSEQSTCVIHMNKNLMPKVFTDHTCWYNSIVDSLKSVKIFSLFHSNNVQSSSPSLIYIYDNAIHGFCVLLNVAELETLKKSSGFISASCDRTIIPHTTYTPEFLSLNYLTGLWPASKLGNNVIIGVVDSGIWPENPSFKDDGMPAKLPPKWKGRCQEGQHFNSSLCNSKIIGARYFNSVLMVRERLKRVSMNSARDCTGHGTSVSSIAAGNFVDSASYFGYAKGVAKGVAPRARIAVYKVSWIEGCHEGDALAGIESAIADGVDVINLSFSYDHNYSLIDDPLSIATFSAAQKGILVSCSTGNKGPNHKIHNGFPWTITVTAGDVNRWHAGFLLLGNGLRIIGWSVFPSNVTLQSMPIIYNKTLSSCNSQELLAEAPDNGIIICDDVGNFRLQLFHITTSNLPGAILISDSISNSISRFIPCPCVLISRTEAKILMGYIESTENPLATISFQHSIVDFKHQLFVARYASRGPSYSFAGVVKPDAVAPGTMVLVASLPNVPVGQKGLDILYSNYSLSSGTSLASPHVAGLAALLKGAHPEWSPAAIRSAILTTARSSVKAGYPIVDAGDNYQPASPLAMGSGYIDPNRALDPGLIYDATPQDYINLLCEHFSQEKVLAMSGLKSISCENSSSNLNYPSFLAMYSDKYKAGVRKFQRVVTNVGNGATKYGAKLMGSGDFTVIISPEVLVFERKYEKKSFSVTVEYEGNEKNESSFCLLVWVEENGEHSVTSPIVLSPMVNLFT